MTWRPSHRTSKRISAVLLRAMERGDVQDYTDRERTACVDVLTSFKVWPGQRATMGALWSKYGASVSEALLTPGRMEDDEMAERRSA